MKGGAIYKGGSRVGRRTGSEVGRSRTGATMIESCIEAARRELLIAERAYLIANGWTQPNPAVNAWQPPPGMPWAFASYTFGHAVNRQRYNDRSKKWAS